MTPKRILHNLKLLIADQDKKNGDYEDLYFGVLDIIHILEKKV